MPEDRSGCYGWISNGPDDNGRILHSAWFDFNDEVLQPFGASCFASSVGARRNQYFTRARLQGTKHTSLSRFSIPALEQNQIRSCPGANTNVMSSGKPDNRVGNVVDLKSSYLCSCEPDGQRSYSVVQVLQPGRSDNGRRDFGFRQDPCECDLRSGNSSLPGDQFQDTAPLTLVGEFRFKQILHFLEQNSHRLLQLAAFPVGRWTRRSESIIKL